jgi:hypothetical protein
MRRMWRDGATMVRRWPAAVTHLWSRTRKPRPTESRKTVSARSTITSRGG